MVDSGRLKLVMSLISAAFGLLGTGPFKGVFTDQGSSMCLPAIIDKPVLKSFTDLAMGPSDKNAREIPMSLNPST